MNICLQTKRQPQLPLVICIEKLPFWWCGLINVKQLNVFLFILHLSLCTLKMHNVKYPKQQQNRKIGTYIRSKRELLKVEDSKTVFSGVFLIFVFLPYWKFPDLKSDRSVVVLYIWVYSSQRLWTWKVFLWEVILWEVLLWEVSVSLIRYYK